MGIGYTVVGHRGFPSEFPENTLLGLVAAAKAGADAVELDVQVSRDGVPIVYHDETLARVSGQPGFVWDYTVDELKNFSAHEESRFGQRFFPCPISTLAEVCEALAVFGCDVFIELKHESLIQFGRELMLDAALLASSALGSRRKIISFDYDVLPMVRERCALDIGWVLEHMDDASLEKATRLQPEVLAYDVKELNAASKLWPGPWQWFLYDIVDPELAAHWHARGVQYIETWDLLGRSVAE